MIAESGAVAHRQSSAEVAVRVECVAAVVDHDHDAFTVESIGGVLNFVDFGDDQVDVERIELDEEAPADSQTADQPAAVDAEPAADISEPAVASDDLPAEDLSLEQAFDVSVEDAQGTEEDEDDRTLEITGLAPTGEETESAPAQAPASEPQPTAESPADGDDDDLIDDEIIEIFQEEVGEVLEALDQYFPRWAANTSDEESLVEFRRAFHTLKGSGRMVGASTVGELGWSVENMLNRVIDRTIEPTSVLIDLVQEVRNRVPALVDAFTLRQPDPFDVQPLADAADTLATGGQLDQVPAISDNVDSDSSSASNDDAIGAHADSEAAELEQDDDTLEISLPADSEPLLIDAAADSDDSLSTEDLAAFNDATDDNSASLDWDSSTDAADDDIIELQLPDDEEQASTSEASPYDDSGIDSLADIPDMSDSDDSTDASEQARADDEPDPVLREIFASEARRNLALIEQWLATVDPDLSEHTLDNLSVEPT